MAEAVLRDIARSSRSLESSQRQFKQTANENNRSITKIVKDIATTFAAQRKDSADISNAINESIVQSQQTASKVDATNGLLQESVTLQSMMVNELKNMRIGIRNLGEKINQFVNLLGGGNNPAGGGGITPPGGITPGNTPGAGGRGSGARNLALAAGGGVVAGGVATYLGSQALSGGVGMQTSRENPFSGSQQEAFAKIEQAAKAAGSPDPKMTAAIAMLESDYLKSKFAQQNNPFGQSITQRQIGTEGIIGGRPAADGVYTAMYDSLESAVKHHVRRWGSRYVANDPQSTLRNLVAGGYNRVAPDWSSSVFGIYQKNAKSNPSQQTASNNMAPQASQGPSAQAITAGGSGSGSSGSASAPSTGAAPDASRAQQGAGQSFALGQETSRPTGGNGRLPDNMLVSVGGRHRLQKPAAEAYMKMVEAAKKDGITWDITDSYRTYDAQVRIAREKGLYSQGGLAARPGTSNHGWGTALDLGQGANVRGSKQNNWLMENAHRFGFSNIPREPWHWEFKGGGVEKPAGTPGSEGPGAGKTETAGGGMGGMGYNPMAMMGMFGGGRVGAIAGAIGSLAPMIVGGLIGGIGGMGAAQAAPLQPQQAAVERGNLFDFKQFSQLPEDQQTSARFFEAEMNERLRKSQSIQERAVATNVRREQADQRTAETPPPPPPRPDDSGGGQTVINNNNSSGGMFQGDNWMKEVYARFGGGTMPTVW